MTTEIKILEGEQIAVTRAEYEQLRREYERMCMFMVDPPSFEAFVRMCKGRS